MRISSTPFLNNIFYNLSLQLYYKNYLNTNFPFQFNRDGFYVIEDFLTPEETEELHKTGKTLCIEAPKENRKIFSTTNSESNQNRENYFLESGDKIRYFFEKDAVGQEGELLVDPLHALNKVGHALHTDHPTFNKFTFSNRVKEICWQLGYRRPAVPQSMYIYKNPGIGGEVISHQDAWFLKTEPNSVIGFWIALEDATLDNGCLQFIRGSHTSGAHRRFMRNPDPTASELLIYDRMAPIYPQSNFTPIPVSKGKYLV